MSSYDNDFPTMTSNQSDWDADIEALIAGVEQGYKLRGRAGAAINTGYVIWMNSGGFCFHFDPKSESIRPHGMALTAASSGDDIHFLRTGAVRSLGIHSLSVPGRTMYVSVLTPGLPVNSYSAANRAIGFGIGVPGIYFDPNFLERLPETITGSWAISAVTGSLHTFMLDGGRYGWSRETKMVGNSANLVTLKFYSDAARTNLLYSTISGGVTTVGSFLDRAGWPYENTDVTTYTGLIYGTLKVESAASVGSDTITITNKFDRSR